MLIHIDGSAVDDVLAGSRPSRDALENLLIAHYAGKHVVSIDLEHADALAPVVRSLSMRARGTLKTIRSQWAEIKRLRGRVACHMKLGVGPAFIGRAKVLAGQEVIWASLHHFEDPERVSRSVLLGENPMDAELYAAMGEAFVVSKGWRAPIAFDQRGGGGSTVGPVFKKLASDGRIILVITDSDKKHTDDRVGGTAKGLDTAGLPDFQRVIILHVRCVENLLRSAIYHEAFDPHRQRHERSALARLMHAEALPSTFPWRDHADLKKGLKLFQVRAMPAGGAERTFWSDVAVDLQRDQCAEAPPRQCVRVEDCVCYVTDALGREALGLAVAWIRRQNPKRWASLLDIENDGRVAKLCEVLMAWGIAPPGGRT